MRSINKSLFLIVFLVATLAATAQPQTLDKVIAVVGNKMILQSQLENQIRQVAEQGEVSADSIDRCQMLEEMLYQRLLLYHSEIDSVTVSDNQVEAEMDRRLRYFVAQIGSEKKLEEYYGKSIAQIKDEFKGLIRDQLLAQQMQQRITSDLKVTPAEVKAFFKSIPEDSLPFINAEVEVLQIAAIPEISKAAKQEAREKIEALRERVLKGEKFQTLAVLYSEDPGSARRGGELGLVPRGTFVPEFEAVAFNLKPGEVSKVFESPFGFHFMQLIERLGEQINVRHILITAKSAPEDLYLARQKLDTVYTILKADTITFAEAASRYSSDVETKNNQGLLVNPNTGTGRFSMDELDPQVFMVIDKLKPGEFSEPVLYQSITGKQAYRILYLKTRTEPHRANLKDDYQRIQDAALANKQKEAVTKWVAKKMDGTFLRLSEEWKTCTFENFKIPVQ